MSERHIADVKRTAKAVTGVGGRHVNPVIGVERYQHWPRLSNAVRDANGAASLLGGSGSRR